MELLLTRTRPHTPLHLLFLPFVSRRAGCGRHDVTRSVDQDEEDPRSRRSTADRLSFRCAVQTRCFRTGLPHQRRLLSLRRRERVAVSAILHAALNPFAPLRSLRPTAIISRLPTVEKLNPAVQNLANHPYITEQCRLGRSLVAGRFG